MGRRVRMSLDASEQALASFTDDGEEFRRSWTVDTINRGLSLSPPGFGDDQTLGLTDRRLLWLDENLEEVDLDGVMAVERKTISKTSAPLWVRIGAVVLTLGIIATPALWFLTSLSTLEVLTPLLVGVFVYTLTTILARISGQTVEEEIRHQYLQLQTERSVVQIYADKDVLDAVADAIETTPD